MIFTQSGIIEPVALQARLANSARVNNITYFLCCSGGKEACQAVQQQSCSSSQYQAECKLHSRAAMLATVGRSTVSPAR